VLDNSIPRERLAATLGAVFAIIALLLAAAGFYGVVAYAVVRRTREIGIRIALGAQPRHALWLMLREILALTIIGAVIGIALGRVAGHAVQSQLYGISASDPRVPVAAALLLVVVGLLASALPARRATRVDPLIALRSE
jgi:ABC-type antimicrobial peptide transport system permease subunit